MELQNKRVYEFLQKKKIMKGSQSEEIFHKKIFC